MIIKYSRFVLFPKVLRINLEYCFYFKGYIDVKDLKNRNVVFFYLPLNVVMVFSRPAVPNDFIISDAVSRRSGSAVFSASSQSPRT